MKSMLAIQTVAAVFISVLAVVFLAFGYRAATACAAETIQAETYVPIAFFSVRYSHREKCNRQEMGLAMFATMRQGISIPSAIMSRKYAVARFSAALCRSDGTQAWSLFH